MGQAISGRWLAESWATGRDTAVASTSDVSSPNTAIEANVTYVGVPNQRHTIFGASWSYNGPTNGSGVLTVEAGSGNIVFTKQLPSAVGGTEDEVLFTEGLRTTRSSAMIVRLTGVAGVKGQLSVLGHRME